MSRLEEITRRHPVRKTPEQKEAFLRYAQSEMKKLGYAARVEENGRHRNLVAGDPETAEILFTAHYDTPANKLLSIPLLPRNLPLFLLAHLGVILLLFLLSFGVAYLCFLLTRQRGLTLPVFLLAYYALLMLLVAGPANRHNVNGSTGVAAVLELMERLPEDCRDQAAFILFDNGEKGRLGSRAYAARHPDIKKRTPVFHMECVGVGDHLLVGVKNFARATYPYADLQRSLSAHSGMETHFFPSSGFLVPSDHQSFRCGMCAVACRKRPLAGFYTPGLDTARDTQARQENIDFLTQALTDVVKTLAEN